MGVNDPSAGRTTRYEGAIVRDANVLLIQHREHTSGRTYWVFPGGGRESQESEQECVRREVEEETGLLVTVIRLLIDEPEIPGLSSYKNRECFCASQAMAKLDLATSPRVRRSLFTG